MNRTEVGQSCLLFNLNFGYESQDGISKLLFLVL